MNSNCIWFPCTKYVFFNRTALVYKLVHWKVSKYAKISGSVEKWDLKFEIMASLLRAPSQIPVE